MHTLDIPDIACPYCHAQPGEPCRNALIDQPLGHGFHPARVPLADVIPFTRAATEDDEPDNPVEDTEDDEADEEAEEEAEEDEPDDDEPKSWVDDVPLDQLPGVTARTWSPTTTIDLDDPWQR